MAEYHLAIIACTVSGAVMVGITLAVMYIIYRHSPRPDLEYASERVVGAMLMNGHKSPDEMRDLLAHLVPDQDQGALLAHMVKTGQIEKVTGRWRIGPAVG